jgi:hypothetical protein
LRKYYPSFFDSGEAELRLLLSKVCKSVDDGNVASMSFVLPMVIFLLGEEFPTTTSRLSKYVGSTFVDSPEILLSENLQGLDEYREKWEIEDNASNTLTSLS